MIIGLIDVDGHNFPNLALMKISTFHKSKGDRVEWWNGLLHYDRVYKSKVFDDTYSKDIEYPINADEVIGGGTGYDLKNVLPCEIEHSCPDYGLYGITDTAYGFTTRGCPRNCSFCIVSAKEGNRSRRVADVQEFWTGQKIIELLDPNLLACKEHIDILRSLAGTKAYIDFTQGLDCRLLTEENIDALNNIRLDNIHFAWDHLHQEKSVMEGLKLYAKLATRKVNGHLGCVYVLANFDSSHEEDLYRVETLRGLDYDPYVMIYNKPSAPKITKHLQRWCNNRWIFRSCSFDEYLKSQKSP